MADQPEQEKVEQVQQALPADSIIILPVRQTVLFPGIVLPLAIGRKSSIAAAQEAVRSERMLGVILQTDPTVEDPAPEQLHTVGTAAQILRYVTAPDGTHHVIAQGVRRFRVIEFLRGFPFLVARVEEIGVAEVMTPDIEARVRLVRARAREAMQLLPNVPQEMAAAIENLEFGIRAGRFHCRHHRCQAFRKAGSAGDHRYQGTPRQASCAAGSAYRGAQALQADRRADPAIALLAAARAHPARAASPHSERARRRRRKVGRNRRAARSDRKGRHAEGGRGTSQEGAQAARAHARSLARIRDDPHLSGLADRAAMVEARPGQYRHRRSAPHPG